jgi:glutathionylspermidine synthase
VAPGYAHRRQSAFLARAAGFVDSSAPGEQHRTRRIWILSAAGGELTVFRVATAPRPDWEKRVEEAGLIYHHTLEGVYWDESAYWQFSTRDVDRLERATHELQALALRAAQYALDRELLTSLFKIPPMFVPQVYEAWNKEPPCLYFGRFDLAYDGVGEPQLLEYNADTPTGLIEAAVVQWFWLQDVAPKADQFNSIHERLIKKWTALRNDLEGPIYFAHVNQAEGEDLMTVTYLRDTASAAGWITRGIAIDEIGWNGDTFVDAVDEPIKTLFKLYPWEWLIHEQFGRYIAEAPVTWIEPIWKMLWSNKALLALMHQLEPTHPNLLRAYVDGPRDLTWYVKKPLLAREGCNVQIVQDGQVVAAADGDYGDEGFVYQDFASLPEGGAVIGSWIIDGEAAGIGIREPRAGTRITTNMGRFVPHLFE